MNTAYVRLCTIITLHSISLYSMNSQLVKIAQESATIQTLLASIFSNAQDDHGASAAKVLMSTNPAPYDLLAILKEQAPDGSTIIHHAARHGKYELIKTLGKTLRKANIPIADFTAVLTQQTALGTPLEQAIVSGNAKTVKALLKAGADANQRTSHGTPLEQAIASGNTRIVKELLHAGANADQQTLMKTPLAQAITSGDTQAVAVLLKAGASPAQLYCLNPSEQYPLVLRAALSSPAITRLLLHHGANPQVALSHQLIGTVSPSMLLLFQEYLKKRLTESSH